MTSEIETRYKLFFLTPAMTTVGTAEELKELHIIISSNSMRPIYRFRIVTLRTVHRNGWECLQNGFFLIPDKNGGRHFLGYSNLL